MSFGKKFMTGLFREKIKAKEPEHTALFTQEGREPIIHQGKPIGSKYHPVTNISWRDAIIWCNALTEWYNARTGSNLVCVYYTDEAFSKPIRAVDSADDYPSIVTPGTQDNPFVNPDADGFRLPSRDEWVLAALYQEIMM